jgi:hypothetical protein
MEEEDLVLAVPDHEPYHVALDDGKILREFGHRSTLGR